MSTSRQPDKGTAPSAKNAAEGSAGAGGSKAGSGLGSKVAGSNSSQNAGAHARSSRAAQQEAALREELSAGILVPGKASSERHAGIPGSAAPNPVSLSVPRTTNVKQAAALPTDSNTSSAVSISAYGPSPLQRGLKAIPGKLVGAGTAGVIPALKSSTQPKLANPAKKRVASGAPGGGASALKGTPARSIRYSLPVRVEKPVRSSKVTGKHVVLPSESQLAPLPESEESSEDDEEEVDEEEGQEVKRDEREQRNQASSQRLADPSKLPEPKRSWQRPADNAPGYPGSPSQQTPKQLRPSRHTRAPPRVPRPSGPAYHTFERMAPAARVSTPLPRLTSYAVGAALHLPTLIGFLRREHGVKPRLYDECAYVQYHKPLLPGFGKANVRSAPEPRGGSPGAESRIERELIEREESGYVGSYFAHQSDEEAEMDNQGFIHGGEGQLAEDANGRGRLVSEGIFSDDGGKFEHSSGLYASETEDSDAERARGAGNKSPERDSMPSFTASAMTPSIPAAAETQDLSTSPASDTPTLQAASPSPGVLQSIDSHQPSPTNHNDISEHANFKRPVSVSRGEKRMKRREVSSKPNMASHNHDTSANYLTTRSILEALQVGEFVILPYGVLVMFNFSAAEEKQIIEDIISTGCIRGALPGEDIEVEAFHFCYEPTIPAPRIFNDFFTFRTPNHLLKLSLAHAIAQSTKLSVFEENMQRTLELTSHIPRELASTGGLQLKRREALRLTGRLFKLRVDVNLTSNVLDTPELFWSEASLQALYTAIREYLEIDSRVENLNERLAVANDLLDIIHEHISNEAMSKITLIIIVLILVACVVACGEISARLILHARQASRPKEMFLAG